MIRPHWRMGTETRSKFTELNVVSAPSGKDTRRSALRAGSTP
jgi:hypothetical protein